MAEIGAIARPYARALFELAKDSEQLSEWSGALELAGTVADSEAFRGLLSSPTVERATTVDVLIDICRQADSQKMSALGDQKSLTNLFRLLAENRRLSALVEISVQFEQLKADVENILDVVMTSALPVSEEQQTKLRNALKNRLGREVNLRCELDESLIGGARLKANDLVIDGTVLTGLDKMSAALVS